MMLKATCEVGSATPPSFNHRGHPSGTPPSRGPLPWIPITASPQIPIRPYPARGPCPVMQWPPSDGEAGPSAWNERLSEADGGAMRHACLRKRRVRGQIYAGCLRAGVARGGRPCTAVARIAIAAGLCLGLASAGCDSHEEEAAPMAPPRVTVMPAGPPGGHRLGRVHRPLRQHRARRAPRQGRRPPRLDPLHWAGRWCAAATCCSASTRAPSRPRRRRPRRA